MVISCDRGGGEEHQCVSVLEEEEVMVLQYLYSLPQTVTTSNGSDRGTKGWGRGGVQATEIGVLVKPQVLGWRGLSEVELAAYLSLQRLLMQG